MNVQEDVALAPFTTLGVGGPARYFTRVTTERELTAALSWAKAARIATFVLGGGSNLVVSDDGLDALVVHMDLRGIEATTAAHGATDPTVLKVAAGEPWDEVVRRAAEEGWAGIECLAGIPGQTGSTPIQNVGAYGQEVGDSLTKVIAVHRETGERVELTPEACAFGYRDSAFKRQWRGRYVITSVELSLRLGQPTAPRYAELSRALGQDPPTVKKIRDTVLELRRAKAMVLPTDGSGGPDARSAGSFFTNPIVDESQARDVEARARASGALQDGTTMPSFPATQGRVKLAAGWLIERAGFVKGTARGNVGLSTRHALAIVNRGGATAADIVDFARFIRDGVNERFGVRLIPEPELVGFRSNQIQDLTHP